MLRVRPGLFGFPGDLGLKTNSKVGFSGPASLGGVLVVSAAVGLVGEGPKDIVGFGSSNLKLVVVDVTVVAAAAASAETVVDVAVGLESGVPNENPDPGVVPKLKPPPVVVVSTLLVLLTDEVVVDGAVSVPNEKPPPEANVNFGASPPPAPRAPLFSFLGTVESLGVSQAKQYRSSDLLLM